MILGCNNGGLRRIIFNSKVNHKAVGYKHHLYGEWLFSDFLQPHVASKHHCNILPRQIQTIDAYMYT